MMAEDDDDRPWQTMAEGLQCIARVQHQIRMLVEEQNGNIWKIHEVMAHRRKASDDEGTAQVVTGDSLREPLKASDNQDTAQVVTQEVPCESSRELEAKETKTDTIKDNFMRQTSLASEVNSQGSYVAPINRTSELASIDFLALGKSINQGPKKEIPSIKEGGISAVLQARAWNLLNHHAFEPAMGVVITANSICLGVAIDQSLKGRDTRQMNDVENFFLAIFILEILLRIFVHGPRCLRNGWNMFDFSLVCMCVLSQWVLDPIMQSDSLKDNAVVVEGAQQILVLRMLRLLRLVRAVRLVATFKPLWKLTQGFLSSAGTMASAAVMMSLTLFIFACIGAEVITKMTWETKEVSYFVQERFSTLPLIMLSLIQFITHDSMADMYFPMILEKPALCIYFLALIIFVGLAITNLITAMLVTSALSSATEDKEMETFYNRQKEKKLRPCLQRFFRTLDRTEDNVVTAQEIIEDLQGGLEIPGDLKGIVTEARIVELFDHMDHDGNGELSQEEFVNGMLMVAFSDVPVETKQMLHLLQQSRNQMHKLEMYLNHISHVINRMKTESRGSNGLAGRNFHESGTASLSNVNFAYV